MNISHSFLTATLIEKIVAAGGSVITDLAVENGNILGAFISAIFIAIAIPFRKTLLRKYAFTPHPLITAWLKRISSIGSTFLIIISTLYMVFGSEVTINIDNNMAQSRRSMIVIVKDNGNGKLGTAEIFRTDDQGVLQLSKFPGSHNYLLIKPEGDLLHYSMAVRNKSLFPLNIRFKPPFNSAPLIRTVLDRFVFDRDNLPDSGTPLLSQLQAPLKNPEQWYLVIGHTDTEGEDRYNKDLGLRRAKSAAEYLESLGVPRHRIIIGSGGSDFPADRSGKMTSNYNEGEPIDRRVEIFCLPNPYMISSQN